MVLIAHAILVLVVLIFSIVVEGVLDIVGLVGHILLQ
jgi:hypothetical protein